MLQISQIVQSYLCVKLELIIVKDILQLRKPKGVDKMIENNFLCTSFEHALITITKLNRIKTLVVLIYIFK